MDTMTSIIVTTYNWPLALSAVLTSLSRQTESGFEVIVADDGSTEETTVTVNELKATVDYPLHHVWQEDNGFRAASCRNKAVNQSIGEYLIFLDGDCIVRPDFLARHLELKEAGWFVRGNRAKLSKRYTRELLEAQSVEELDKASSLLSHRLSGDVKRILPLLRLPLGYYRYSKKKEWFGVKTCNLGVFRQDFVAVNGFNEDFEGWGHEDADLAIRLIRSGVYRKEGVFATTVFHCHHNEVDRTDEEKNRRMLQQSFSGNIVVENGLQKNSQPASRKPG